MPDNKAASQRGAAALSVGGLHKVLADNMMILMMVMAVMSVMMVMMVVMVIVVMMVMSYH